MSILEAYMIQNPKASSNLIGIQLLQRDLGDCT